MVFITAFIAANIILPLMLHMVVACVNGSQIGCAAVFLTAPFSALEDYAPTFGATVANLVGNFVFIIVIMLVAEVAAHSTALGNILTMRDALLIVVGATYFVSLLQWILVGAPATGTSIIGFSLCLYIIIVVGVEIFGWLAGKNTESLTLVSFQYALVLVVGLYAIDGYVYNNAAMPLHIIGGAISAWVFSLVIIAGVSEARKTLRNVSVKQDLGSGTA